MPDHDRPHFVASSRFAFGDRVTIDNDVSLIATVTAFSFRCSGYTSIELSWIHAGTNQVAVFEEWRLRLVEDQ